MVTIRTDCLPGIVTSCFVTGGTLFEDEVFLDAEHLSRSFGCLDLNLADLGVFSEALLTAVGDGLATMIFLPEGCLKCNVVSLIIVSLQIRRHHVCYLMDARGNLYIPFASLYTLFHGNTTFCY